MTFHFTTEDWIPLIDIKETRENFVIYVDLPGVKNTDIKVLVENGVLIIKGRREITPSIDGNYKRLECYRGKFIRRITSLEAADLERVWAETNGGVLKLVVPKIETALFKPINIDVQQQASFRRVN